MTRLIAAGAAVLLLVSLSACASPRPDSSPTSATTSAPSTAVPAGHLDLTGWRVDELAGEFFVPRSLIAIDDATALLIDQVGVVRVIQSGAMRPEPLLDVSSRILTPTSTSLELGLAGFALAPDFSASGHAYTFTTERPRKRDPKGTTRVDTITRWTLDRDALRADPASARVLFRLPRDFSDHVGGELLFDSAGLLYAGLGTPGHSTASAQNPRTFDGTVIRIHPTADGYKTPSDNAPGARPEVWSYGYRNPWRLAHHPSLGVLVGSAMWVDKPQQINVPERGDNAGYPDVTDACWQDGALQEACARTAAGKRIAPPVLEYGPTIGNILSGVTVAPDAAGALAGKVVVSDWKGAVLAATPSSSAPWAFVQVALPPGVSRDGFLWDIDMDAEGRLYLMYTTRTMERGSVARLSPPA